VPGPAHGIATRSVCNKTDIGIIHSTLYAASRELGSWCCGLLRSPSICPAVGIIVIHGCLLVSLPAVLCAKWPFIGAVPSSPSSRSPPCTQQRVLAT
jgi:hypothetical protein